MVGSVAWPWGAVRRGPREATGGRGPGPEAGGAAEGDGGEGKWTSAGEVGAAGPGRGLWSGRRSGPPARAADGAEVSAPRLGEAVAVGWQPACVCVG